MKVYNKIRGSMKEVPSIEVNKDTVYVRFNIREINEEDFKGFEYDEIQYEIKEYIEHLSQVEDVQSMAMLIASVISEMDYVKKRLDNLEGK
ncbi:hypothetical protein EJM73_08195 [Clostridium botulinum]|uniref:hypothetical protein n=1 Tax=Clostridium botulinum TaxID=1491 RepID=UPI0013759C77|nr:hypothetical protein [Clostridium botulinum]NCI19880.1 hypothetical protein [Clostridium botulinum]NCI35642.1 hypothetical protein [Clostridium botulinum]NCI71775.1 hypothetical protein [Clostridium botulinum]NDI38691.1 hypothetical protein [Clostridium botulinum]